MSETKNKKNAGANNCKSCLAVHMRLGRKYCQEHEHITDDIFYLIKKVDNQHCRYNNIMCEKWHSTDLFDIAKIISNGGKLGYKLKVKLHDAIHEYVTGYSSEMNCPCCGEYLA